MLYQILSLVAVGFLWGATNPFIKIGSKGIDKIKEDSKVKKFFLELLFLIQKKEYVIPFVINQLGSVLYFILLQDLALSVAVPIANSFSFVFTAVTSYYLGERPATKGVIIGSILITIGSALCCLERQ